MRPTVPSEILALGRARAAARRSRDFAEADRVKAEIEAAGWRVIDRGTEFTIVPAHPADVTDERGTRYGWSGAVPSRLTEPDSVPLSVVIVADGGPESLARTLASVRSSLPGPAQAIVVAGPDPSLDAILDAEATLPVAGSPIEIVRTASTYAPAAARNAGMRRATGSVVAWLACGATLTGDLASVLAHVFADPHVAVAGLPGLAGADVRALEPAEGPEPVAIGSILLAFRRGELATVGMPDEAFAGIEPLCRWWSLVLRDGPDMPEGEPEPPIRRAVAPTLPVDGTAVPPPPPTAASVSEAARRDKRDRYRLIDRFGRRADLLGAADA